MFKGNNLNGSNPSTRILFDLFMVIALFLFPWWVFLGVGVVSTWITGSYIEFIILAFILDVLYFMPEPAGSFPHSNITVLLTAGILSVLLFQLRKRVRV